MKEEAPTKKLPPKMFAGVCTSAATASTPTKAASDEILSTLLRINNFDSISSIKDDSLDIDLSACVTINADPAGMISMSGSLSSTDFWRMLDESAQNQQLEMTTSSSNSSNNTAINEGVADDNFVEQRAPTNSFSGTFLRPEPPMAAVSPFSSPLKKYVVVKTLPAEPNKQRQRAKISATPNISSALSLSLSSLESKKSKVSYAIKEEPPEQLLADSPSPPSRNTSDDEGNNTLQTISTLLTPTPAHTFSVFMLTSSMPTATKNTTTTANAVLETQFSSAPKQDHAAIVSLPPPLYKCLDCDGQTLRGQAEFSVHEAAAHRIWHKCNECERDFEQEAGLKKHLKTHRSVEARKDAWKKCPDCGKCLKLGSMWMHRKIHSDNKKYGCDICGQKFVQKINLTHHSRVHTAEKPYECPECQKRFQERSHLQRHQKYHAQTRSYRCEKCGKMYKTERCLKVHNLVHLEQRPFACNVCDKSFISNSKLKQHSNIHTGERPFKCNYCPRDFTNFPNWLKHTRRRHKVDHKTGEHLENIPSYCSKKSSKTTKATTATVASETRTATTTAAHIEQALNTITTTTTTTPKTTTPKTTTTTLAVVAAETKTSITAVGKATPARRKKKGAMTQPLGVASDSVTAVVAENFLENSVAMTGASNVSTNTVPATANISAAAASLPLIKTSKAKRERKQLQPKQVQKSFSSLPPLLIRKELLEPKNVAVQKPALQLTPAPQTSVNSFPDLHCLSITSAEDLIMEQALEMEECGLYDAPATTVDSTDNAISSEAAAALHFRIKNEFSGDQEEEFISLNETKSRVLCSSLESSPFSSPASIDFNSSAIIGTTLHPVSAVSTVANSTAGVGTTTTTFYMPSFALSSQGALVTTTTSTRQINASTAGAAALEQHLNIAQQSHNAHISSPLPSTQTQALINHLYLPMMPLPSVDTLFSSAHAHASANSFFHGKGVAQAATAQHNMS